MDLQLAKWWRRRSILVELMWLLSVLAILVVIGRVAWWCWTKWLSLPGQVDTLLAIGAILNFFQLIFGTARRRCTHWLVQYGAFIAFYFPVPLVAYALSIMRSASHIEADLPTIIIWAQLINLAVRRRLGSMASYRLNDTVQHGMRHARRILYPFYWLHIVLIACADKDNHLTPAHILTALLSAAYISSKLIVSNFQRLAVPHIVSSYKSKKLAEYVMTAASYPQSFFNSSVIDMKNCRYPFEVIYDNEDQVMVMKDVLRLQHGWEEKTRIEKVCLSYSLFNMIKRRHYGFPCAEQGNKRVLEFVMKGFPAVQNDHPNEPVSAESSAVQNGHPNEPVSTESSAVQYDIPGIRVFEVVEMQLAFLHDHFFIECSLHQPKALLMNTFTSLELLAYPILNNFISSCVFAEIGVSGVSVIYAYIRRFVGLLLFLIVLVQEYIQFLSYSSSDWFHVWAILQRFCGQICYFQGPSHMFDTIWKVNTWLAGLFLMHHRQYWQNKIGQYSLIKDCDNISVKKTLIGWLRRYLLDERYDFIEHQSLEMDSVSLPDIVKEVVFSYFHQSEGILTNGISSLEGNNVSELLSWTCNQATHTDTILIWHVATWYCECETEKASRVSDTTYYKVATALSKYCAYLVAFLPEFLPEHSLTTMNVFQGVIKQARELLDRAELEKGGELGQLPRSRQEKFALIQELELRPEEANMNTVENGVKLGRQLNSLVGSAEEPELRWKVMAEFWAETMVYVAPSDKVSAHIDQLAKGGEFVTHIWALLSDAGILERPAGVNVNESTALPVYPPGGPPTCPNHEEAGNSTGISPW